MPRQIQDGDTSTPKSMDNNPIINSEYKSPEIVVKSNSPSKYVKESVPIQFEEILNTYEIRLHENILFFETK